ncbi:aquaporin AQPAn.G-like isoform X2 [Nylanderia fulva]|uniref:aquaporin AQPAn.G-like isoform X2 n=1 Tax=Nylanderia fulva TaxID=613905 RepID=UPI0010FB0C0E|nr:aquaporin AQPAn.G-like isoform X2 [Nylanderia fulva]
MYCSYPCNIPHRNIDRNNLNIMIRRNEGWKPSGMNVSTVFPEGYVENERIQRHATAAPKEEEGGFDMERYQRVKEFVGLEEVTKLDFLVMLFAEILGTFLLVLLGCASCITWSLDTPPTVLHIAFTFGLAVASLAQVLGPISGCHVNPAVSLGLMVSGNCSLLKTISYVVCQCCGAIAGAAVLKLIIPGTQPANGLGATMLGHGVSVSQGVVMEAIITFLLVLVVHAVTDAKRSDTKGWAPLAIGLTIATAHMAAVPITGSSMNPARTLGPAVVEDAYQNIWVYWVGPLLGALLAGGVYRMGLRAHRDEDEGSYDF